MKPSTALAILYGLNLVTALVGAGFLAAFLGQLYAEDPLIVFQLPVAIWVNGVAAFFGILIFYLVTWLIMRATHFESGLSSVVGDTFAVLFFVLTGVAATAGLTGENVFRLNCREQPMWSDVLALCLPAAIGAAIAWGQVGLLLLTLAFIIVTMRDYPEGWKESMYSLSHPRRVKPVIHLDKDNSNSPASSFGSPYSTMERKPLVGLIPEYPPRRAPGRDCTRRSGSESSGSIISPISPLSPASPSEGWPSRWGSPPGQWPTRLPPGGIYSAYADAVPTQSYWRDDPAIPRPQPSLDMDRDRRYYRPSLDLERLITPPSPARSRTSSQGYVDWPPLSPRRSAQSLSPPARLANPPPLPPLPAYAQHLQTAPYESGFGARQRSDSASSQPSTLEKEYMAAANCDPKLRRQRQRSDSASSRPSLLEKEYMAAALGRPLSGDFETASVSSNAPSCLQTNIYTPDRFTYTYEKARLSPQSLTPPRSAPSTPRTRREFRLYGNDLPPLPPPWGVDNAAREKEHQRELERATKADMIARAHRKLSQEIERAGPSRRTSQLPSSPVPAQNVDHSEFGYPSEAIRPKETMLLPKPTSVGEALGMPLPRDEWEVRVKRPPGFRV
ncbi:uncharacterized protein CcaverHIS019_0400810 [Cutaneotrichosporon cavernicola]|uniref:Uncharacterized protein n=1 Tax=Cutaneotrichosporon cavernicola TaxID=279322 RepID=A0AA48QVF7_9TREE|nr:uncharacterized protein CcaverHIS019_0400810 [Cutaneotrichosporon cavernicola]BEI91261.1 hypothetical protein CcaverHIS019_0400810 [Cutaneotrichosporon cavernicola]BEI99034.1 hypothetical protein CcaverHIS631_0400770 [Cutaneotrichosporon cavernicola]BEJ06808.1 hypothetical protein CcaverHIS641_0400770 [Cutaneotrichosporon cavernicola]